MKRITLKIIALVCVFCMLMICGATAFAADSAPSVSIVIDKTGKSASIKLSGADMMFYSAQLTLNITPKNMKYTLTSANSDSYCTVTADGGAVTLYIDSTNLIDGSKAVNLGTLKANQKISVKKTAELILLDRSMRPVSYSDIKVSVKESSSQPPMPGGGSSGIGGGSLSGGSSNIFSPSAPVQTAAPSSESVFTDVPNTHWAKASIAYVTEKGLFQGVGDGMFAPEAQMTRAMFVTAIKRFGTNIDEKWQLNCENPMSFDDVSDIQWFSEAVEWAGGVGVVSGIGDNKFGPDNYITREQIAVMTVNFANLCGVELAPVNEAVEFSDASKINNWAAESVRIAQQAGLLYGRETGEFSPQDTATRAEVAAILQRLVESTK